MSTFLINGDQLMSFLIEELKRINTKLDKLSIVVSKLELNQKPDLGDWLSEDETRALLNRGATSLWDLRKRKKIIYTKIGNQIFYSKDSILKLLERNKDKAKSR
jgi:hypothetical protein